MMEIQGESSSSNDVNQKIEKSEEAKEQEPENKKLKQDELAKNTEEQEQNDIIGTSINDLPTEMLMELVKYVDDKNLMVCRLLNRKWLEISTETLCARNEIELQFTFDETNKIFKQIIKTIMEGRSLSDFIECFKESKKCFYNRFLFRFNFRPSASKFENDDWFTFISCMTDSIKCLKLVVEPTYSSSIIPLSEHLSDLLVNEIPQLEEFGLAFSSEQALRSPAVLFPSKKVSTSKTETTSTTTTSAETTETTITTDAVITTKTVTTLPLVQLPNLKVLHVNDSLFSTSPGIVNDLLKAAVNLKSIKDIGQHRSNSDWRVFLKAKDYGILHARGKLDLLEEAKMTPSVELFSALKGKTPGFKLKKLQLFMLSIYKDKDNWADASAFISQLFESSKDTLRELTIDPVGFLPQVKFPSFPKLEMLTVEQPDDSEIFEPVFPSGIYSMDIFPTLHTLEVHVDLTKCFPGEENIPRIPTVETLFVSHWNLTAGCVRKLSLMCPNLKNFRSSCLYDEEHCDKFPEVGRAIWTHMKKLQSLDLQCDFESKFKTFHALDSAFTGFSIENCRRLFELMRVEKYLKRWNSPINLPQSDFETPVREHVSILDLKDLRKLSIKVDWDLGDHTTADDSLKRGLTCISEIYTFKLMKNLNYTIEQKAQKL